MVVQDKSKYRDVSDDGSETTERKQRLRERFEVIKKLGQGTYGKVQLALNKETKQEVAIKTIKKAKIENEQDLVRIRREIQIMSSVHHPHIIHIYEVFENQEKIVLVMQYASGGELYDYLGCRRKLDENEARRVFRQVASAIFYCHKNRICHRDLKLENILLDDRGNAKIADFGLSNVFDERSKLKTFCGSPLYASPEIVRGTPYSGPEVDCWSLGVLLYTLVYGAMPFDGSNFKRLVKQISEGEYFEPKEKSGASGLIRRLLTVDVARRATVRDICADWWVNQGYDHSLLKVASDMASLAPVRVDLLLALNSASPQKPVQTHKKPTEDGKSSESRSTHCNGYYTTSHPVRGPASSVSARREGATTDGYNNIGVNKDIAEKQVFSKVDTTKYNNHHHQQQQHADLKEHYADSKLPATQKNQSNTLIIVQDLMKDILLKVEQTIGNNKMGITQDSGAKQAQEIYPEQHILPQVESETQENGIVQRNDIPNITTKVAKKSCLDESKNQKPEPKIEKEKEYLGESNAAPAVERFMEDHRTVKKAVSEVPIKTSIAKNVTERNGYASEFVPSPPMNALNSRRQSVPIQSCTLQSRKSIVTQMEPDVVIPIFNVCSNIPKRNLDDVKRPPRDERLNENHVSSLTTKSGEHSLKALKYSVKSRWELHQETENSVVSSNNEDTDVRLNEQSTNAVSTNAKTGHLQDTSPHTSAKCLTEYDSLKDSSYHTSEKSNIEAGRLKSTPPNLTTPVESVTNSAYDVQTDSDAPKLPPRRRFLIRIPKLDKPNEESILTGSDMRDSNKTDTSDKEEIKKEGTENKEEELENRDSENKMDLTEVNTDKEHRSSSDKDLIISDRPDAPSGVKSTERKSRRDSSKRCLYVNSKTAMNRDSLVKKVNFTVAGSCESDNSTPVASDTDTMHTPRKESEEIVIDVTELHQQSTCEAVKHSTASDDLVDDCTLLSKFESLERDTRIFYYLTENSGLQEEDHPSSKLEINEEKELMLNGNNDSAADYHKGGDDCTNDVESMPEDNTYPAAAEYKITDLRSSPMTRPRLKQRSLSRTRALSLEFENLAQMSLKIISSFPKKPPGKVEIPKTFDPTQPVTSPKAEMKEIIFIPTACVSENKEKIEKKIEKVKKSAIVIPPRRKSDAGVASRKKKYTRSKTDFIPRCDDFAMQDEVAYLNKEAEEEDLRDGTEAGFENEEDQYDESAKEETIPDEMWYSAISTGEGEHSFGVSERQSCHESPSCGFYDESTTSVAESGQEHRHSVDAESGYWTPPEIATGEQMPNAQANLRPKGEKASKKCDHSEKIMLQRAAFQNSRMRMKLSDEGLDMCSLSSSLESGIYSWRQEEANGKRTSPDSELLSKVSSPLKFADGSYAPIARSFKKMTFPAGHSSASELSESIEEAKRGFSASLAAAAVNENHKHYVLKSNGEDSKPIKSSDSQSSYGSNDISDDVFEAWVDKEDVVFPCKEKNQTPEDIANRKALKIKGKGSNKEARQWQHEESWRSFSTDKESSDNDDDLDLMVDDSQMVYGTEGLWQFLKSVNQHLSSHLKTVSQKVSSKTLGHRSKSQESKHPDDLMEKRRPVTRSLSREDKQLKKDPQLRHFVSEGGLVNADSLECFDDLYASYDNTRYSSGYLASGSSLGDYHTLQKDFASSEDGLQNYPESLSIYGTLRKDKHFQSASAVSSPCLARRKISLQNQYGSGDLSSNTFEEDLLKHRITSENERKMSLYGTLRPRNLSQQGRAQSQILLSTDDGYQLLYNERSKKDSYSETQNAGIPRSTVNKASSELNVSNKETILKDYEKLLLGDDSLRRPSVSSGTHRNPSMTESSYQTANSKPSRTKKSVTDKSARRVSFSSDVKSSKNDFHATLRLNSLNKVREANEELLSSSSHKNYVYDEEQESGSLLEALKTYGYKGIMSQKFQNSPERYEPRLNHRLTTDPLVSLGLVGLHKPEWENLDYLPMENTLAYQKPLYPSMDPMECYHSNPYPYSNTASLHMKSDISQSFDLDSDSSTFTDSMNYYRLKEGEVTSRRKALHKLQDFNDLRLAHMDQYGPGKWEANSARKKSLEGTTMPPKDERRNSGSDRVRQNESESEGAGSTDVSESRSAKQTENTIEILSEKIQALKSRCQRKSLDEGRLRKDLDECGMKETQNSIKTTSSNAEKQRPSRNVDASEELTGDESESSESVSERIWRKSFFSRFNELPAVRRRKSFHDSEYLPGFNSLRSTGKFNIDEEGGVEEPWMTTSLKRRNSQFSKMPLRDALRRTSPLSPDAKGSPRYLTGHYIPSSDSEHSSFDAMTTEMMSANHSKQIGTTQSMYGSPMRFAKYQQEDIKSETVNPSTKPSDTNVSDSGVLIRDTTKTDVPTRSDTNKDILIDIHPKCERMEDLGSSQSVTKFARREDSITESRSSIDECEIVGINTCAPEPKDSPSTPEVLSSRLSSEQQNEVQKEVMEKTDSESNHSERTSDVQDNQLCNGPTSSENLTSPVPENVNAPSNIKEPCTL